MDASIKTLKANHKEQLKRLGSKTNEESFLLEEIRSFLKRRAEIEHQYHEDNYQLCQQFLAKKPKTKDERPTSKAWYNLLEETVKQAKIREDLSVKLKEDLVNSLKNDVEEKKKNFTKFNNHGDKILESLHAAYDDLSRLKSIYDSTEKESQKTFSKLEELQKVPNGSIRKLRSFLTDTNSKLDTARKKFKNASRRAQDARNEYLLGLDMTNAHHAIYYEKLLPFLMKKVDGNYFEMLQKHLTVYANNERIACNETVKLMDHVIEVANTISREVDYSIFMQENNAIFGTPPKFGFEPFPNDPVKTLTVDEISKIVLSTKLGKKKKRLDEIEAEIAKKNKELEGISKMTQVYDTNPNFGKASESQDEVDVIYVRLEELNAEKYKIQAQVDSLTKVGVEVINPIAGGPPKRVKKRYVIALYDFQPMRDNDLTLKTGDIILVVEDGDEWMKGELNGVQGMFPANYVRNYEEEQKIQTSTGLKQIPKARALYDFEGQDDGDLSFKAGDVIEVLNKEDEWWEGRINGRTGVFPMLFVEEEEEAEGSDTSSISSSTSNSGSTPNSANLLQPIGTTSLKKSSSQNFGQQVPLSLPINPPILTNIPENIPALSNIAVPVPEKSNPIPERQAPERTSSIIGTPPLVSPNTANSGIGAGTTGLVRKTTKKRQQIFSPDGYPMVVAIYDYVGQVAGELTFKKGDSIEVTNKDIGSDAWWEGKTSNGVIGQFPKAYVKEMMEGPPPRPVKSENPKVEALYDYAAQYEGELAIKAGDIIELTNKIVPGDPDGSWWEGRLNGVLGQFPKLYVKEL